MKHRKTVLLGIAALVLAASGCGRATSVEETASAPEIRDLRERIDRLEEQLAAAETVTPQVPETPETGPAEVVPPETQPSDLMPPEDVVAEIPIPQTPHGPILQVRQPEDHNAF